MMAQRLMWIAGPFNMIIECLDDCNAVRICPEWDQGGVFKMEIEVAKPESY